jgi:hypothetical protein
MCCVLPMRPCVPHSRMCTTLGKFSRDGDFDRRRGLYIKEVQPQDARSINFFQDRPLPCPKHVGATATNFVAAQPTRTSPERTIDCCCHYHFKSKSSRPPSSRTEVSAPEGARQIQQGPQPKELPRLPRQEG